jgi:hypothetical protein
LGDRDDRHGGWLDAGEAEQIAKLQLVERPAIVGNGSDVELETFELATVEQGEDGVAQPAFLGLGRHRPGSADLEEEAVMQVGVKCLLKDVAEVGEFGPPGGISVLGGSCGGIQSSQQRLASLECPGAWGATAASRARRRWWAISLRSRSSGVPVLRARRRRWSSSAVRNAAAVG